MTKVQKPKKISRSKLLKKADVLFSKVIRSPGYCLRCGSRDRLQCAHLRSRNYKAVRWDRSNAICLCSACHVYFTYRPLEWEVWIEERFPGRMDDLKYKALNSPVPDYQEVIMELQQSNERNTTK